MNNTCTSGITKIVDDVWINVFTFVNVKGFVSIRLCCSHFYHLTNPNNVIRIGKYWQNLCKSLCKNLNDESSLLSQNLNNSTLTDWYKLYITLLQYIQNCRFLETSKYIIELTPKGKPNTPITFKLP